MAMKFQSAQLQAEDSSRLCSLGLDWDKMEGKTLFLTGGTGLIGSQILYAISEWNKRATIPIRVIVMTRSYVKFAEKFSDLINEPFIKIYTAEVKEEIQIDESIDYIIHGASMTASADFINKPVETIETTYLGVKNVLELAKDKQVEKLVFLSTCEIYGILKEATLIDEDAYGYFNPTEIRSSYPEAKRVAECLCRSYYAEYGVQTVICRLGVIFGIGTDLNDNRMLSQFARNVIQREPIELKTSGTSIRTYCYTRDAVAGILLLLSRGEAGGIYNLANEDIAISVKEIAERIIEKYKINRLIYAKTVSFENYGYLPELKLIINSTKLKNIGWKPEVSFDEGFQRMIEYLQSSIPDEAN